MSTNNYPQERRNSPSGPRRVSEGPQNVGGDKLSREPHTHSTPIFAGKRITGVVIGDVFLKKVTASKHFLRRPPAIAFDVSSLEQAQQAGAVWAKVVDRETMKVYFAMIETIMDEGFRFNRGHGDQVGPPLAEWNDRKETKTTSPTWEKSKPSGNTSSGQVSLFGGHHG